MKTVFTCQIHLVEGRKGRRFLMTEAPADAVPREAGRIPRVTRLMALAIRIEGLVASGELGNYSEAARLGHVTRARASQIMNLTQLAPDLQEQLLFLPRVEQGRDRLVVRDLQPIARIPEWSKQRVAWEELQQRLAEPREHRPEKIQD